MFYLYAMRKTVLASLLEVWVYRPRRLLHTPMTLAHKRQVTNGCGMRAESDVAATQEGAFWSLLAERAGIPLDDSRHPPCDS